MHNLQRVKVANDFAFNHTVSAAPQPVQATLTFSFVREPIRRFVSGYTVSCCRRTSPYHASDARCLWRCGWVSWRVRPPSRRNSCTGPG